MTPLLLLTLLAAQQQAPTYAGALRCLALVDVEAETKRRNLNDPALAAAFDAGIEWSMAARQAADRRGITPDQFDADLGAAATKANADLAAGGDAVRAELATCIKTAPPLTR